MNTKTLLAVGAVGAALTLSARADFFDNFDTYANQAAFNGVWTAETGGAVLSLSTGNPFSSPNSISQSTTASARVYHYLGSSAVQGDQLDLTFEFYYSANSTRDFGQVYSRTGSAFTSGLNGALSLGTFNTTAAGKFSGRFTSATPANGAIFADGATIISATDTTGWFALNISRTVGWHAMEVVGMVDPAHTGKAEYKFYVDGVLGGSVANAPDSLFNFAVLGGANSTGSGAAVNMAYYDDFKVAIIPEPSTIALGLLGGLGMVAFRRRKI